MAGDEPIKSEKLSFYLSFSQADIVTAQTIVSEIVVQGRKVWPKWNARYRM